MKFDPSNHPFRAARSAVGTGPAGSTLGRKVFGATLTLAGLLAATAVSAEGAEFSQAQVAEGLADLKTLARSLGDQLRNPAATRFRNVVIKKAILKDGQERISICGDINAQTGLGGMSGFRPFGFSGQGTVHIAGGDSDDHFSDNLAVAALCDPAYASYGRDMSLRLKTEVVQNSGR